MKKYLLPQNGDLYKCALHCHSRVSDGSLSPADVKERYKGKGYHAVAFTDHDVLVPHSELTDTHFVALSGYEITVKEDGPDLHTGEKMRVHHINLIAKKPENTTQVFFDPRYVKVGNAKSYLPFVSYVGSMTEHEYSPAYLNRLIAAARDNGFLVHYNHPRWSFQTEVSLCPLTGLDGIEVYNADTVLMGDDDPSIYKTLLKKGKRLYPIAADDMHKESELGQAFQMVKAPALTYESITSALEKGDTYASTGPVIYDLYIEDDWVCVTTSDAVRISLCTDTRAGSFVQMEGSVPLTAARLPLPRDVCYIRIEVRDARGNTAYTRAYFPDEYKI